MTNPFWPSSLELLQEDTSDPERRLFLTRCKTIPACCIYCGVTADRLYKHGTIMRCFTEIPVYPQKVIYGVEVQRWMCRECGKTFSQALPDMDDRHHMTNRCLAYIRERGVPNTFLSVAREIGVTEKTVRNICTEHFVGQMETRKIEASVIMGIDELKLAGQMRAIFMDIGGKRAVDLIHSHRKRFVAGWLAALPNKEIVRIINIDMAAPYRDAVQAILPQAAIVVDKFHIQRAATKALDKVRNRVRKESSGSGRKNPWGPQRLLRRRPHSLSVEQEFELDGILKNNPMVQAAWTSKEAFMDIWNARSRTDAELMFAAWRQTLDDKPDAVRKEFGKIARTVDRWRKEVFAYFDYPSTNAFTENRNGIVKLINRTGRGYSFPIIRAKALLSKPHADTMSECDACHKPYPTKSLQMVRSTVGPILDDGRSWGRTCGNCAWTFHKKNAEAPRLFWGRHAR